MRFILLLIISFFLIFPSYAYDEKIKLNRTNNDTDSKKKTIKVNLNNMLLDLRKIKQVNKKYASIERYVKETSRRIVARGKRIKYRGKEAVDIYKKNAKSVVFVDNYKNNSIGSGSFIKNKLTDKIDSKGLIVTNWHVVGDSKEVHIYIKPQEKTKEDSRRLRNEAFFIGKVVKRSKRKDLALIQVEGFPKNIKPIPFGKTSDITIGSNVWAIGHPEGQTWSINAGMVSQIRPKHKWRYEHSWHLADVIQHEVPTNPGNSGGPLFDKNGFMIGVNSFTHEGELLNFSVAIEELEVFLTQKEEKKPKYLNKKKKPTYITRKCKEKSKYLQKKCVKKQSAAGDGIKKTYPGAIARDANNNGIEDTWYVDENKNGKIDLAFVDDNEDGIIEAIMLDENENRVWEIITVDEDLNGSPDILLMDRDEDGKMDIVAYDYNEDGEWDKFEEIS